MPVLGTEPGRWVTPSQHPQGAELQQRGAAPAAARPREAGQQMRLVRASSLRLWVVLRLSGGWRR